MRRIVPFLLALMLCASASAEYVFCTPDTYVNVRSKPSGEAVGWIDCGTWVDTDGKTQKSGGHTWAHVTGLNAEDTEGWICSEFLTDSPVNISRRTAYAVAIGRLAIRKSPNGKVKGWLENGEKCTVLADADGWAIPTRGYVMTEFLEFVEVAEDE